MSDLVEINVTVPPPQNVEVDIPTSGSLLSANPLLGDSDLVAPSQKAAKTYSDAETERALAAEGLIAGDLATELQDRETADGILSDALDNHVAAADPHGDRAYADSLVIGLVDDRGNFDASINTFPTAGGSGTAGAILKGDLWTVSVVAASGPLVGYQVGCLIRALTDTPGQTESNWSIVAVGFGYSPENSANKSTSVTTDQASNIKYPTVKALYDWAVGAFAELTHKSRHATGGADELTPGDIGALPATNGTIVNPTEGVVSIGDSGTAQTIALTSGTFQTVTLTGNCTFTMPTATAGKSFMLKVLTGAGGFTATFTGVKWPAATAPTITATASKYDLISFVADGTAWSGSAIQNYTP